MTIQTDYDFMNGRDCSESFSDPSHNSAIRFGEFETALTEANRVKNELTSKKNGTFLLEEAIPAEYDENGNVIKEAISAVYYKYSTKKALIETITSDLDVSKLYGEL